MKAFRIIITALILPNAIIIAGAVSNRRRNNGNRSSRYRQEYFSFLSSHRRYDNQPKDPNPMPTIEDLEEQATSNDVIDIVLDEIIGVNGGIIIDRYIPSQIWLWRQWYSTVFYNSITNAYLRMVSTFGFCCLLRKITIGDWNVWEHPTTNINLQQQSCNLVVTQFLNSFNKIWKSLLPLTTFVLVFFVTQAYNYWISVYQICRNIQGRINDIEMILATHVSRNNNRFGRRSSSYTSDGEEFLQDISHKLRAFHVLFWASQTRRFRILLTDRGLSRMVAKDVLTQQEKEALDLQISVNKTQKHWILLEWVIFKCKEAQYPNTSNKRRKNGAILQGGSGLEQVLLDQMCSLRTCCSQITNKITGRMALAYVHFVQILVDSFLFMASIVQYNELGIWSVVSVGILTLFYSGLLDLAFDFLDPLFDDKEYRGGGETSVHLDLAVLIRESASAAQRWINAGSKLR